MSALHCTVLAFRSRQGPGVLEQSHEAAVRRRGHQRAQGHQLCPLPCLEASFTTSAVFSPLQPPRSWQLLQIDRDPQGPALRICSLIMRACWREPRSPLWSGAHSRAASEQRHHFANKGPSSQGYGFSSSHVRM